MIDRSEAPAFKAPGKFKLIQPESTKLDNGVPLYSFNVGNLPLLKIEFIFPAGKWFEEKVGASFFSAKMLTEGSSKYNSKQIADIFDQYGIHYEINPGPDYVGIGFYAISRHLEHVLPLIGDLLFTADFPSDELESLKNIQIQQLRVNKEKNSFVAARIFKGRLFGSAHPYGQNLDEQQIRDIDRDDLVKFYQGYFDHTFEVIVSGQVGPEVIPLMNKFFGRRGKFRKVEFWNKSSDGVPGNLHQDKQESLQSSIKIGKKIIKKNHTDFIPLLLVNEIFGGYFGSRLMQNIREDKGFTYGIYSGLVPLKNDCYFVISTEAKKEFREQTILETKKELGILAEQRVSETELSKVKNYLKGSFLSGITTPFALADKFKSIHFYDLDYHYYDALFDIIDGVSSSQIKELAQKYLDIDTMIQISVG